jgi:hypothetical protein
MPDALYNFRLLMFGDPTVMPIPWPPYLLLGMASPQRPVCLVLDDCHHLPRDPDLEMGRRRDGRCVVLRYITE